MKVSDYIANSIAERGVRHVFTLPGGFSMHLNDSIGHHPDLETVYMLHEAGAAVAAEAYAKAAGLGVCVVTAGPGATNALTGCASAYCDSVPVLFISGQVKRDDLAKGRVRCRGQQEVDIVEIAAPITKYVDRIDDPKDVAYFLDIALDSMMSSRPGPAWLDVPLDVQAAQIELEGLLRLGEYGSDNGDMCISQVVAMLKSSRRPIILAGAGVLNSRDEFSALVNRLGVPVLTTWRAADLLDYDHPLYAGHPGPIATRAANLALQNADLLLCIGARIDLAMAAHDTENFGRKARRIVVDVSGRELQMLGKMPELAIRAEAGKFIRALAAEAGGLLGEWLEWFERCSNWKRAYPATGDTMTWRFMDRLSNLLKPEHVIVLGPASVSLPIFFLAFRQKLGQRIYYSNGLGPMGYDIPYAIGACLGSGRRRTICLTGDGSFMQNIQELEVVKRLNLPITFFVFDNGGYTSIRNSQAAHLGRLSGADSSSGLTLPDIRAIVNGFMIPCNVFYEPGQADGIGNVLIQNGSGPTVTVVKCPPDERPEPRVVSQMDENGKWHSGTLEDLYPYLPRDVFEQEMR